jgi:uncharacterized protein
MRSMAALLRRNVPRRDHAWYQARDLQLAEAFAAAGRNDPCPCGSGKKFKQCHGRH